MPPRTREQSSTKAADTSKQESGTEHPQDVEPEPLLFRLPPELQKAVVEYLTRSSDLRNLCRVSKKSHTLTLPHLYRDITLGTHQLNGDLPLTSKPSHPGLLHIRSLRIKESGYRTFDTKVHSQALYRVLSVLPKNGLRIFDLATTKEVDQRLGMFLRITQQNLINYQYHSLESTIDLFLPSRDELSGVTYLHLFLRNKQDCRNAGMLLERTICVTSLIIQLNQEALDYDMGHWGEAGREVINTLFASSNTAHDRLKLRRLRIHRMSFHDAGAILPTVLPCNGLEHLHLCQCTYTDRLCESLSQLNMTLRSFTDEGHDAQRVDAHAIFLKALSPLQSLHLTGLYRTATSGHDGFPWSMIVPHATSLRRLEIHEYFMGQSDTTSKRNLPLHFGAFCMNASSLQQLSMAGPEIEKSTWRSDDGLCALLDCIRKIRTIRVLKLTIDPDCLSEESLGRDIAYESECEHAEALHENILEVKFQLQSDRAKDQARLAGDLIFDSLVPCCPWFVALVIELNTGDGDCIGCVEYLRSKQTDVFGNATHVALPVNQGTVKYYEPFSGVPQHAEDERLL